MCVARLLLILLLPNLPIKVPSNYRHRKLANMEERNYTSLADKIWSDLIPSARVFLTSVTLFLLIALLIMLVILLFIKILHTLWPRHGPPLFNFRPSSIEQRESDADAGRCNGSERDHTELKVRFRGSDGQMEGEQNNRTPPSTNYAQIQDAAARNGQNDDSFASVHSAVPSPATSTPANPNYSQGPSDSPALSPLNPLLTETPQRPTPSSSYTSAEITPKTLYRTPHSTSFGLRKAKAPDTFSGKTDLEDWLRHFEIISRWNGWNEEEMGSSMASSLRGSAQQVLRDLPAEEMEDYQSILRALKRRFDPEEREGFHKDHFKTRYKKKEESSSEYGFTLSRIAASAYPRMSQKDREEIVIDQFINGLPTREIQKHVKFGNPKTLDKAIALATEYEGFDGRYQGRKPEDRPDRSVRAIDKKTEDDELVKIMKQLVQGQKDMAQDLLKVQKEMSQGPKVGSNVAKTPPPLLPTPPGQDMTCFNCGAGGTNFHIARFCPHPPKDGQRISNGVRGSQSNYNPRTNGMSTQRNPRQQNNNQGSRQTNSNTHQSSHVSAQRSGN